MLVDLEWDLDAGSREFRREYVKTFDTTGGSLVITLAIGGEEHGPTCYADRLAVGVYRSHLMTYAIRFTKWQEVHSWAEYQAEFARWTAMPDGPDREAARRRSLRRHNEFGYADDLSQVLRYGREFVRSPNPYVLAVRYPDRIDEKWHKNGAYVRPRRGRFCPEPGCVHFHFYRLALKSECEGSEREREGTVA